MREYLISWAQYLTIQKGYSPLTSKKYISTLNLFIEYLKSNELPTNPELITRDHIDAFMKYLYFNGNRKNSSRANKLSALKSFFNYLIYTYQIQTNPTIGISTPRFSKALPVKFTTEDLSYIFQAPDKQTLQGIRDLAMLKAIYGAGLRVSEVCNLQMGHLIESGGHIRVNILNSKGDKSRTVTLRKNPSDTLRAWLSIRTSQGASAGSSVFVGLKHGGYQGLTMQSANNILKKYGKIAGINEADVFVHKLRATFATDLYDSGRDRCAYCNHPIQSVDVIEVMRLLGHSDPKTTMRYIAVSERYVEKIAIPDRRWTELEKVRR